MSFWIVAAMAVGFMLVIFVGYSVIDAVFLQKARMRKRVDTIAGVSSTANSRDVKSGSEEIDMFPTVGKLMESNGFADKLMLELMRAGVKLRPSEFIGIVCSAALVLALLAAVSTKNIAAELLALMIGVALPYAYVKSLQTRRLAQFNLQLPDALALISSAIRSGFSFQRAMQMVAEEMPPPISEEFQRVINEMNVGLPSDVALMNMVSRVQSYDVELVVTAVIIQQQIGGNLAEVIENIAGTIRERVKVEGEISALTAEGRISGIVLTILPFGMGFLLYIINPTYMKPLFAEPIGMWLILGAVFLQILGGLVIKRMLVLDY